MVLSRHGALRGRARRAAGGRSAPALRLRPLQDTHPPPRPERRAGRRAPGLMHCELVIPGLFSAPAEARLPSLELLLARGRARSGESQPLERWLAEAFGLEDGPIAAGALTALAGNRDPGEERWVRADPVHLRLMRDRLILVPAAAFGVSREEAEALCETLNEHFAGRLDILPVQPQRWSARLQMELEVSASSPFDLAGRELQAPQPGDAVLNEAQMVLHEHPVNEAREARGEPAVNSLWLWGAGRVPLKTQSRWQSVAADDPLAVGLARVAGARQRGLPASAAAWLERLPQDGGHPLLARIFAARRIASADELRYEAASLLHPNLLKNAEHAAQLLADAIARHKRLLIVADYDADGATACAVGMRALRRFGANVEYLVPDRFKLGYGLSPELVDIASQSRPDVLITVDNGIASVEGVAHAKRLGIATLITDHHLPGAELPDAACIVNPNQPDCAFPSKALAGVGVMFYVMLALRSELRRRGALEEETNLGSLTDLVALGTIADVVPLDANNRNLVAQGLKRLRAGHGKPGIVQLLRAAGRAPGEASSFDLGFVAGPRLNAAGRLADMSLGIECLVTDDEARAANCAQELDRLNRERRKIEAAMLEQALDEVKKLAEEDRSTFFVPGWHEGVVGILASRLKDRLHRPVVCFARSAAGGLLKGSGRSLPGLHLRDCLDLVAKRAPGLIQRFGGHAQAAGLTIAEADYERFCAVFERTLEQLLPAEARLHTVETDGALEAAHCTLEVARLIEAQIWGQGFPQPLFCDTFAVESQRVVGERHLKLRLIKDGRRFEAMRFGALYPVADRLRAAYRLSVNEFNGLKNVQLNVEHIE